MRSRCFGSLPEECCAGRQSHATFVTALAGDDNRNLRCTGPVIRAGKSTPGDQFGPAERDVVSASLSGTVITTVEHHCYPERYTAAQVGGQDPTAAVTVRHRLRDGRWTTS